MGGGSDTVVEETDEVDTSSLSISLFKPHTLHHVLATTLVIDVQASNIMEITMMKKAMELRQGPFPSTIDALV